MLYCLDKLPLKFLLILDLFLSLCWIAGTVFTGKLITDNMGWGLNHSVANLYKLAFGLAVIAVSVTTPSHSTPGNELQVHITDITACLVFCLSFLVVSVSALRGQLGVRAGRTLLWLWLLSTSRRRLVAKPELIQLTLAQSLMRHTTLLTNLSRIMHDLCHRKR